MPANNIEIIGNNCTGCGACASKCNHNAIIFNNDSEGFLYPHTNNNCINCGLCLKVCHIHNPQTRPTISQKGYIAITRNNAIYKNAASGGIWGTFANLIIREEKGAVSGAAYINGEVRHIIISDNEYMQLSRLQNSKYVQSNTVGLYAQIRNVLSDDKKVLFSGTPCQVAGLYAFLGKRYDNLTTIDLICHGVPSPEFLRIEIERLSKRRLDRVDFRWKNAFFAKSAYFLCLSQRKYAHSRSIFGRSIYSSNADPYFSLFLKNASFRESCYKCPYACLDRVGDITIGDCDSAQHYSDFHPKSSCSTIIINTKKGEDFWNRNRKHFDFKDLDLEKEALVNTQLRHPSKRPDIRDIVYKDLKDMAPVDFKNKYGRNDSRLRNFIFRILDILPYHLK